MTVHRIGKVCFALAALVALNAGAKEMNWTYGDFRYQQPTNSDFKGLVAEFSGHMTNNWLLGARVNHLSYDAQGIDLWQTRYELSVGHLFHLGSNLDALVGGGYTHLDYGTEFAGFEENAADDAGHVQATLRASFLKDFEAEGSVGMLFDEEDTSDVIWSAVFRWHFTSNLALVVGVNGSETAEDFDDVLYELGLRFDLGDPKPAKRRRR